MLYARGAINRGAVASVRDIEEFVSLLLFQSTHLVLEKLTLNSALALVFHTLQFDALQKG